MAKFFEFNDVHAGVQTYNPVWVRDVFEPKVAEHGGVEIGGTDKSTIYRFDDVLEAARFRRWAEAERLDVEDVTAEWEG